MKIHVISSIYFKFWWYFLSCKNLPYKICTQVWVQPPDLLFLVVLLSFTSAFTNFRTSFNINYLKIWFLLATIIFFNRFTQTPHPLQGQNLLSVMKVFCQCSLSIRGVLHEKKWNVSDSLLIHLFSVLLLLINTCKLGDKIPPRKHYVVSQHNYARWHNIMQNASLQSTNWDNKIKKYIAFWISSS